MVLATACVLVGTQARPQGLAAGVGSVVFVENQGQWDASVRFAARRTEGWVLIGRDAITFTMASPDGPDAAPCRLVLEGAEPCGAVLGVEPAPGVHHFFQGNSPDRWRGHVPGFYRVVCREVRAGVDLQVRGQGGIVEYDLILAPGAALDQVILQCQGVDRLELTADGSLRMHTRAGVLCQKRPVAWYTSDHGDRQDTECGFEILAGHRLSFVVPNRDPGRPLVIDPGVEWLDRFAGTGGFVVVLDADGTHVAVGGAAEGFKTTQGAVQQSHQGGGDACVMRLDSQGKRMLWATYLGGSLTDSPRSLAITRDGEILVAGETSSPDYPITPGAWQKQHSNPGPIYTTDCFVTRLDRGGGLLRYSTYLGGTGGEHVVRTLATRTGAAVVVGETISADYPTTAGAYQPTRPGYRSTFLSRLSPQGSALELSTYLGGSITDFAYDAGIDGTDSVTIVGGALSPDFPTTVGAFSRVFQGGDAFVTRMDPSGTVRFSTFFGGSRGDLAYRVVIEADGASVVAGGTSSTDLPITAGAVQRQHSGGQLWECFLARLDPTGARLMCSTYLGGSSHEEPFGLAAHSSGAITVTGYTASTDFPTTAGAWQRQRLGTNMFVTRLDARCSSLLYSTYVGGANYEMGFAVALLADGSAVISGNTTSPGWAGVPTRDFGPFNGMFSGIVCKLDMLPTGVSRFGTWTPACAGPQPIGVTRMPVAGDALFATTCGDTRPYAWGYLLVGAQPEVAGTNLFGSTLHVGLGGPFAFVLALSNHVGLAETPLPIPPGTTGARCYTQYLWPNPAACGAPLVLSASNALELVIQ